MQEIIGLLIGFIAGYLFIMAYENFVTLLNNPKVVINERHIHHSIYGLLAIVFFIFTKEYLFLGLAIGIILRHTQAEHKFTIISKG
jgi:hypothetical protein